MLCRTENKKACFPNTMSEHINVRTKSAIGSFVIMWNLGFKSVMNKRPALALRCRLTTSDVCRSTFDSECRLWLNVDYGWFDEQL